MRSFTIGTFTILTLVACRQSARPVGRTTLSDVGITAPDPALLQTLNRLTTGHDLSPPQLAATRERFARGELTMTAHINSLLADKAFSSDIAPLIVFRQVIGAVGVTRQTAFMLKHTDGEAPIYYLNEPCAQEAAVSVHPWWAPATSALVCPDSYRPEKWDADPPKGSTAEMSCMAYVAKNVTVSHCGCGPNLVRCYDSMARRDAVTASMRNELRDSVAHLISENRPIEDMFLANETFRDRNAEFMQREQVIEQKRLVNADSMLADLPSWPETGRWAPREELAAGQHAGVLTTPQIVFLFPDIRQRMGVIYDLLWCVDSDSIGASPEKVLAATSGNDLQIQSEGWKVLAARQPCGNCHARLDYGGRFFQGYPNAGLFPFFSPAKQLTGTGQLYERDLDDPRGEGDLNPHSFAKIALAQPEFQHCMARDFAEYVRGNQVTPAQVDAVERRLHSRPASARELMRVALEGLVADWSTAPDKRAATEPAVTAPSEPTAAPAESVAVVGTGHKQLEDHCLDCHSGNPDPSAPDLSAPTLERSVLVQMLDDVAFGRMPKGDPLPTAERSVFIEDLLGTLFAGDQLAEARAYYLNRMAALPAYRPEVTFRGMNVDPGEWRFMETNVRSDEQQLTPGLAAVTSIGAIEMCRRVHKSGPERSRCIADTITLDKISPRFHR